jgi:hypothetical protein
MQHRLGELVADHRLIGDGRRVRPVARPAKREHVGLDPVGDGGLRGCGPAERVAVDDRADLQEHRRVGMAKAHHVEQSLPFPRFGDHLTVVHAVSGHARRRDAGAAGQQGQAEQRAASLPGPLDGLVRRFGHDAASLIHANAP